MPSHVEQLNDTGAGLAKAGQYAVAQTLFHRAIAIEPTFDSAWGNLGVCYYDRGLYRDAKEPLEKAVALAPEKPGHLANLGHLCGALRQYDRAEMLIAQAISLSENAAQEAADETAKEAHLKAALGGRWDLGLSLLKAGRWERGWPLYEARKALKGPPLYLRLGAPMWRGENLDNKRLLVIPEQGLGDRIAASRFFAVVKERWPTVSLLTCGDAHWQNLLWEMQLAGVVEVLPNGIQVPWDGVDHACYMMDLLGGCGVTPDTIPADPGYIRKRAEQARAGINLPGNATPGLKVGLAWTGAALNQDNHKRSVPIELLLPIAEQPGVTPFSLQAGPEAQQLRDIGAQTLVYPLGEELIRDGYVAAAASMLELDLVITACTATAHLAGAVGVPTWLMLSYDPYWLWQTRNGRTPWYPSVKVFKQSEPGDWASVVSRIRSELERFNQEPLRLLA